MRIHDFVNVMSENYHGYMDWKDPNIVSSIPKTSEKVYLDIDLFGYERYVYDTYMTGKLFDYKKMFESEETTYWSRIITAGLYSLALVPGCCTNRLSVIQKLMGYKRAVSSDEGDRILYEVLHLKTSKSTLEGLRSGAATWTPSNRSMTVEERRRFADFR